MNAYASDARFRKPSHPIDLPLSKRNQPSPVRRFQPQLTRIDSPSFLRSSHAELIGRQELRPAVDTALAMDHLRPINVRGAPAAWVGGGLPCRRCARSRREVRDAALGSGAGGNSVFIVGPYCWARRQNGCSRNARDQGRRFPSWAVPGLVSAWQLGPGPHPGATWRMTTPEPNYCSGSSRPPTNAARSASPATSRSSCGAGSCLNTPPPPASSTGYST